MDKTVYTFKKNQFQEIRASIREYKGNDLIDIRTWTTMKGEETFVPTAKGVTVNIKLLSELKKAIELIEKEIE